ncbi:MAG: type III-A CRISPR-associated protein Cas10/Csm1 [Actinobacteria bacterium]|nr:type III-A CRISPR-associated protein Cas10/Csm1 [Actinomycetota bacterium]
MKDKLVLGALLHDIGKLVQRADARPTSKTHSEFGAEWLEKHESLRGFSDFARYHHSPSEYGETVLLGLLHLADWLAAGERLEPDSETEKTVWERELLLLSLFSKISSQEERVTDPRDARYYELVPASQLVFPKRLGEVERRGSRENYGALLVGMEGDIKALGPNVGINSVLFLLEKYLSFVPSYTRHAVENPLLDPDISLYDHCKLTAAIALCLFLYCGGRWGRDMDGWSRETLENILSGLTKEGKGQESGGAGGLKDELAFLLVDIDLSGIQNFIYNISTKRAARSLRARSFYLEVLCEDLAHEVLERCGLERPNLLLSGGGRVRILAPNLDEVKSKLRDVEREANEFLGALGGGLAANISWVEMRGTDMVITPEGGSALRGVLERLAAESELRKQTRAAEAIEEGMELGPFEPLREECRICHVETAEPKALAGEEGEEPLLICPTCEGLVSLGGDLKRLRCIYLEPREGVGEPRGIRIDLPFSRLAWKDTPAQVRLALVLRERWEAYSYRGKEYVGFAIPSYEHEASTFQEMAEESVGEVRLGVLRMDVDDLGKVFSEGIPESQLSFTRYSVLSRMLNRYFREYLPAVLAVEAEGLDTFAFFERPPDKRRAAEIIYSGGDDLFIVGAWNDILEAAFDISSAFEMYTCENPSLHISGGLVVHAHDHPLYRLATLSEAEEGRAKGLPGKNAFCLFGREAAWSEYRDTFRSVLLPLLTLEEGKMAAIKPVQVTSGDEKGERYYVELPLPKALLRRLMQLYRDREEDGGKLNLPRLCYLLARARERLEKEKKEGWEAKRPTWEKLEAFFKDYRNREITFAALCCADLLSRGG